MEYTKAQLTRAVYLMLDDFLPHIECEKIKKEGNWDCYRCDDCMLEQYLKKAKSGQLPKKERGV